MSKAKLVILPVYPLDSFLASGTTDDAEHCPRCGSDKIGLVDVTITSGQRIGVCRNCGANYIVNPPRYTVIASYHYLHGRMNDSALPMTRQFFRDLAAAEAFYQQEVDLLDTGSVQLWDQDTKIKEVYE